MIIKIWLKHKIASALFAKNKKINYLSITYTKAKAIGKEKE